MIPLYSFAAALSTAVLILITAVTSYSAQAIHEINTRPGITMKILVQTPEKKARATLLFFPGSYGKGHFSERDGKIRLGSNFIVRSSGLFVEKGYAVAIIDTPSDQSDGMSDGFRKSQEHLADIKKALDFLKEKNLGPFYLVGNSRGTISTAYLAAAIRDESVRGVILTATLAGAQYAGGVAAERISMPLLFVHHRNDGCSLSGPDEARDMKKRMINSARADFVEIHGGFSSEKAHKGSRKADRTGPDPCEAGSHHGFIEVEKETVGVITEWLAGRPVPASAGK